MLLTEREGGRVGSREADVLAGPTMLLREGREREGACAAWSVASVAVDSPPLQSACLLCRPPTLSAVPPARAQASLPRPSMCASRRRSWRRRSRRSCPARSASPTFSTRQVPIHSFFGEILLPQLLLHCWPIWSNICNLTHIF